MGTVCHKEKKIQEPAETPVLHQQAEENIPERVMVNDRHDLDDYRSPDTKYGQEDEKDANKMPFMQSPNEYKPEDLFMVVDDKILDNVMQVDNQKSRPHGISDDNNNFVKPSDRTAKQTSAFQVHHTSKFDVNNSSGSYAESNYISDLGWLFDSGQVDSKNH